MFYYTLQHVSAVHISYHQEDVGDTKIVIEGERPLVTVLLIITVLFQKRNSKALK